MARDAGILSMDLDSRQIVPVAIAGAGTHTAAIVGDTGLVLVTNGNQNNVSVFDTRRRNRSVPLRLASDRMRRSMIRTPSWSP